MTAKFLFLLILSAMANKELGRSGRDLLYWNRMYNNLQQKHTEQQRVRERSANPEYLCQVYRFLATRHHGAVKNLPVIC